MKNVSLVTEKPEKGMKDMILGHILCLLMHMSPILSTDIH